MNWSEGEQQKDTVLENLIWFPSPCFSVLVWRLMKAWSLWADSNYKRVCISSPGWRYYWRSVAWREVGLAGSEGLGKGTLRHSMRPDATGISVTPTPLSVCHCGHAPSQAKVELWELGGEGTCWVGNIMV